MVKDIKLKVQEAMQNDVGRGIIRIDSETRESMGLTSGDVVKIKGKQETIGIVWQCYPQDEGLKIIRMDGIIRQNAGVSIGEFVTMEKTELKPAQKITLAPSQPVRFSPGFESYVQKRLIGRPLLKGDRILVGVFGTSLIMIATKTSPGGFVQITPETRIELRTEPVKDMGNVPQVTYEDIGGVKDEVHKVREMIEIPLKHPELFERLGIQPPKGVLLHGVPGTGKTLLAKAVANESDANFISIQGPEVISKFVGEAEERIRQIFKQAEENAPTIIFIDEIDAIAPKRGEVTGEVEKRVVAQLLASMDGLQSRGNVVVIAATNRPNALDEALRRPGRFDREIELGIPDRKGRKEILQIHTRNMPLDKDVDLDKLADITHGYVGADLQALAKEAAMKTLRRLLPKLNLKENEGIPPEVLENLKVTRDDFMKGFREIQPSAMREVLVEVPNVKWNDIGGLDQVKKDLKEAIEWPIKNPKMFTRMGIRPPKGIFLFGPPGTGKTLLAKAVATESEANFIAVKGPELLCVSADTKIFTDHCGATPIEEFYENIGPLSRVVSRNKNYEIRALTRPVYTFAVGSNGAIKRTRIKTVHKLRVDDAYEIMLANNARLTGSANQPLLSYRDNAVCWVPLQQLGKGNYVAYPRRLGAFNKTVPIHLPNYENLRLVREDREAYYVRIFSSRQATRLPKMLTKDLAAFLGWFVSEGNVSKGAITICNYDKRNQKEIARLFGQFVEKGRIRVYRDRVVVYSTPLVKYLEPIFGQPLGRKKSHDIRCPAIIAKATKPVIAAFLEAAYKGDGSFSKTKIEYASKSAGCVEGFAYLFAILGVKARYWHRKDGMHLLTVSGKKEMQHFKNQVCGEHGSTVVRREYNARYEIPPVAALLKAIKGRAGLAYGKEIPDGSFEHAISGRRRMGLLRLQRIMRLLRKQVPAAVQESAEFKTLEMIAKGELLWTQVSRKAKAKPQLMFDVETEDHAFIGGNVPLLLHNSKWVGESERGIREIFRKGRQAAPVVILFDEIDALAPKRGSHMGSEVTETVVNQLLTELDGIEDLKDVVILATSNRPDMVDSGVLRPGRFDRLIFVPAPDEKSRKAIFGVHTKKMPLAKDVDLGELVKDSSGFSGADIEGVCREAAMNALRRDRDSKEVSQDNFEAAMKAARPSIQEEDLKRYQHFIKEQKVSENVNYIG